ncbi:hypothetical protein CBR_g4741 [Chara braunii]|uniref:HECT-type E3 ubiquitin transferase n=1 Tax=Chara braunii TaxID=69332 RepID=A0A388KIN2_CHABU|nr:hypothetical protein CBR_g4741 [Chara braunii]|eukprot:GBG69914.1 hypothetical protein CBR_g4741 [Chara braunii]
METRSRKRPEGTSGTEGGPLTRRRLSRSRPPPANPTPAVPSKRARLSGSAAAAAAAAATAATKQTGGGTRQATKASTGGGAGGGGGGGGGGNTASAAAGCPGATVGAEQDPATLNNTTNPSVVGNKAVLGGGGLMESESDGASPAGEREREREKDRSRDLRARASAVAASGGAGAGGGDDENDPDALHHNLTSASSALHGLLRKLGAGLDDLLPSASASMQNSRLKGILAGLRADGEEGRQLESLSQLCELLSIGTEDSLSTFSVDAFVPVLVGLLNCEYNPDIMLLAARALTHLTDVLPSSCAAVVHYGAVPCFCARLLTIEYIDLAEQSLQALEKISHEHPTAVLRAGGLMAVLSYLDFFSTGVQRVAVSTAANICRQLPSDCSDLVLEVVPILTNLLQYQDAKVVEYACVCLTRLAEAFASSPDRLDVLCSHGLIPQAVRLISAPGSSGGSAPTATLSSSTYTGLVRLLATCAAGSAAVAESLLQSGISGILREILAGTGMVSSTLVPPSALNRPPEQLYEIVSLVNELLPSIPDSGGGQPSTVNLITTCSSSRSSSRRRSSRNAEADVAKVDEEKGEKGEDPVGDMSTSSREKMLAEQPKLLEQFGVDLFPVLIQVYGSSVNPPVRTKCLSAICKILHFSTRDMLQNLLNESNVSSFLAGVLGSKDYSVINTALQIAEMLMQKLPEIFSKQFLKEGVVHALDVLIGSDQPVCSASLGGAPAAVTEQVTAAPLPRPRRGGRGSRRGLLNGEATPEEPAPSLLPIGSPPPPVAGGEAILRGARSGLRCAVLARAKKLKETHFTKEAGLADAGLTHSLCKLKELCARITGETVVDQKVRGKGKGKAPINGLSAPRNDEADLATAKEILGVLNEGEGVSTFEFVGSGVVGALLKFITCGGPGHDDLDEASRSHRRERMVERLKQFVAIALPTACNSSGKEQKEVPMAILVKKLQCALSSLERFPVLVSHTPRSSAGGGGSVTAGLNALTQPFKLRLCRASHDKVLRDYSSNIVLIEPLATLAAVEDFLWQRVKRHETGSGSGIHPPAAAAASSGVTASGAGLGATTPPPAVPSSVTSGPGGMPPALTPLRPATRSRAVSAAAAAAASAGEGAKVSGDGNGGSSSGVAATGNDRGGRGKDKVVAQPSGPETRGARRRAELAARKGEADSDVPMESEEEAEMPSTDYTEAVAMDEDEPSEDEVEDDDEDDDQDDENDEDDDLDDDEDEEEVFGGEHAHPCGGDRVHDVRLGEGNDSSVAGGAVLSGSGHEGSNVPGASSTVGTSSSSGEGAGGAPSVGGTGAGSLGGAHAMTFAAAAGAMASGSVARSARERRSMAAAISASMPPKLIFSMNGRQLDRQMTIFQAIQRQAVAEDDDDERFGSDLSGVGRRLWDEVYTITYRRADTDGEGAGASSAAAAGVTQIGSANGTLGGSSPKSIQASESSWQQTSLLESLLKSGLPCDLERTNPTYDILLLLRVLEGMNRLVRRFRSEAASDAVAEGRASSVAEVDANGTVVPQEDFISSKLTPKLARQMQDALMLCSGGLPPWCHQLTRACPFLFPFETRRQYFYSTAFGLSRALQRLQQQQNAEGVGLSSDREARELRAGRLQRQKVRVSRQRILESAVKVMDLYASHKAVLEVEYFGEVGTGLGPTLEFYTLLSHELQRRSLMLWRTEIEQPSVEVKVSASVEEDVDMRDMDEEDGAVVSTSAAVHTTRNESTAEGSGVRSQSVQRDERARQEEHVYAPHGLFPRPWPVPAPDAAENPARKKVMEYFKLLGTVMAKALQDGRLLDLPFARAFYKLVLGQELDLFDMKSFDPELGRTLEEMHALSRRRIVLEVSPGNRQAEISNLRLMGSRVEDLCLDFTLPGYPDYELKQGGASQLVELANLEEYVKLVVNASVKAGIAAQLEAFRAGFNQVFSISSLQVFNDEELDALLCGRREMWNAETLAENIKFDHGYTASSPPIRHLLEIMGEFTPEEQRAFLQFVTGAPRLPPGGLGALTPRLTIVRKHPTGSAAAEHAANLASGGTGVSLGSTPPGLASAPGTTLADGDLPSVMTCANYLKLPPYSCKGIMHERLMYAIHEGQGSFDLS